MPVQNRTYSFDISFAKNILGLVTSRRPDFLRVDKSSDYYNGTVFTASECSAKLNFQPERGAQDGTIEARPGSAKISVGPGADITNMAILGSSVIVSTAAKLSSIALSTGTETVIQAMSGISGLLSIAIASATAATSPAVLVFSDDYPRLYHPGALRELRICYDKSDYMLDNITSLTTSNGTNLDGTTTRCGALETLPDWETITSVDDIPVLSISALLKATGSPTGGIVARAYTKSGAVYTLLATSITTHDASTIGTSDYVEKTFEFDGTDLMSANDDLWFGIEYTAGDGANYITVGHTTVSSGGDHVSYTSAAWDSLDTTKTVNVRLSPGLAPKAGFAARHIARYWLGKLPSASAYSWYTAVRDVDDYSQEAGTDETLPQAAAFPLGDGSGTLTGIVRIQSYLFFIVGGDQSIVYRLEGNVPDDFVLKDLIEGVKGLSPKACANIGSDGAVLDKRGLISLATLNEVLQVDAAVKSVQVNDIIKGFADANAFICYAEAENQLWIKLDNYSRTLVYDIPTETWCEFDFAPGEPIAFCSHADGMLYTVSGGAIYQLNRSLWQDDEEDYDLQFRSAFVEPQAFERCLFQQLNMALSGSVGAVGILNIYRDGSYEPIDQLSFQLNIWSGLTIADFADYTIEDLEGFKVGNVGNTAEITTTGEQADMTRIYIDAKSLMVEITAIVQVGRIRLKDLTVRGFSMGRRMD